ncbi:hypothetical protein TPHA_0E02940 [Tetrapisispora phaffii CBS 4417]|uniref:CMP/dCMP-type deaminase domain-containing protein n=1 Tax=Tetrapisispora phaffii (strain ATCC 24235 / CBS 4417 / NBRC 1672 / NRRL Y-8282 / UCD 70-5) TaxID=1071381 RepID=G8BU06_TETPH|nr:hypothetical protein TPHA_0E02940 [Tetrapisispora phaffii CBS 4417]CCE63384.1 hypothetical protein TPHA_0E02940 [Tetrapisispora phaffii CBS 4417]
MTLFRLNDHIHFMNLTVQLAKFTLENNETPVACIFVNKKNKNIISYGMNKTNENLNGISHAEFIAIDKLINDKNIDYNFNDIIVYVTVEPCIMCASALKQLGINYIVFGCGNERFGGNGTVLSIHNDNSTINESSSSMTIIPGILRKECIFLLRLFYYKENDTAPTPRSKKNRNLDKNEFPNIDWNLYLNELQFKKLFGHENLNNFKIKNDINECQNINWDLFENNEITAKREVNIIEYLDSLIKETNPNNNYKN